MKKVFLSWMLALVAASGWAQEQFTGIWQCEELRASIVINLMEKKIPLKDFEGEDPLAGVRFQRKWERLAWQEGRGSVPVQLLGDFKKGQISAAFGEVIPRHKGKINAAINNAKVFIEIQKEYDSFSNYIWHFTDNKILVDTEENYLTNSPLSDKIAKDLKKRGMKFVGTTIIYSYLESIGVINNHIHECFRYEELK